MSLMLRIKGWTRELGRAQGYRPLYVRDVPILDGDTPVNTMTVAFELTPDELSRVRSGAPLEITIIGTSWPPISVTAGEPPDTSV